MNNQPDASVVRIFLENEDIPVGAGFLVSNQHILTCAHVVAQALHLEPYSSGMPAGRVRLDFPLVASGKLFSAEVVRWCPVQPDASTFSESEEDIAVLELGMPPPDTTQPTGLILTDSIWDHQFRACGFPDKYNNGVWATGVLRGRLANGWVQIEDVKETGYRVMPGFSGSPVWDKHLNGVVGMVVESDKQAGIKAAYIIPTTQLVRVWPNLGPGPYRGLSAFQEQDAPFFFGREANVGQLVEAVSKKPLVAVIGSSGSGKSSVVFAGLVPRLRLQGGWLVASFQPGDYPFRALASALVPFLDSQMNEIDRLDAIDKLAKLLQQDDHTLRDLVERILRKHQSTHLLLVGDQFEELYTLTREVEQRQQFLDRLLAAVQVVPYQLTADFNLVITLRADFFEHALAYRPFADALQNADLKLGPMIYHELQDAIKRPAQKLNVKIEDGLTERILDAVIQGPGNLPLLEFTLTLMWERQRKEKLTHSAYDELGGVDQALAAYAEKVYAGLTEEGQKRAHQIFVQLVRPGEGTEDIRRRATRTDLGEENWALVVRLATAHLVVTGRDEATGQETVEVVHEALIRGWKRLRDWIESDRKFRTWQEVLRVRLRQWEDSDQDQDALLRGVFLAEAKDWMAKRPDAISVREKAYIQASEKTNNVELYKELRIEFAMGKINEYLLWFLTVLEVVLLLRFILKLVGADPNNLFAKFLYSLTDILLYPFLGIVNSPSFHPPNQSLEFSTLIGMATYFLVFYVLRRFLRVLNSRPKKPSGVSKIDTETGSELSV